MADISLHILWCVLSGVYWASAGLRFAPGFPLTPLDVSFSSIGGIKVDRILMWSLYRRKLEDLALKSNRLNALKKDFYCISHLSILLHWEEFIFLSLGVCRWKERALCSFDCDAQVFISFHAQERKQKRNHFSPVSFSLSGCASLTSFSLLLLYDEIHIWPASANRGVLFSQGFECICAYECTTGRGRLRW